MSLLPPPLLADAQGVIMVMILLLFFTVPVVGRLLAKLRQPPRPPGGGFRPPRPQQTATVQDEIDEFLKRVSQQRPEQRPQPQRRAPRPPQPAAAPVAAAVVDESGDEPVGKRVGEHVQQFLNTQEFTRRTAELGGEVVRTDQELNQHLHQVFDHDVSRLARKPGEAAAPVEAVVVEPGEAVEAEPLPPQFNPAVLFGSAEGIYSAILMNEIMRRPEDRW